MEEWVGRLRAFYGHLAQPPPDPFALYLWEVLSFRALPSRRDAAFSALKRIPALTPDSVWRAPRAKVEFAIGLSGTLVEQRVAAVLRAAEQFRRHPELRNSLSGPILSARRALRDLSPIGEGWASRMLFWLQDRQWCPIDGGVTRVLVRLGLVLPPVGPTTPTGATPRSGTALTRPIPTETTPADTMSRRIARASARLIAQSCPGVERLREAFLYLEHHASACCVAIDPHCSACPLRDACAHAKVRATDDARDRR